MVVTMSHNNNSMAEALNVSTTLYFTQFLKYKELLYCNKSDTIQFTPTVTNDTGDCLSITLNVSFSATCSLIDGGPFFFIFIIFNVLHSLTLLWF